MTTATSISDPVSAVHRPEHVSYCCHYGQRWCQLADKEPLTNCNHCSGPAPAPEALLTKLAGKPPTPEQVWKAIAPALVVPGRARAVKVCGPDGKYSRWAVRRPAKLPAAPTAALLFDRGGRAHWLGLDLDPGAAGPQRTLAAGQGVAALLRAAGFHPLLDRSPRGGVHVWARLPAPQPVEIVRPLLRALQGWLSEHHPGVKFDLAPMCNPRHGCLSLPGSPAREGGHRELVSHWDAAQQAVIARPPSQAIDRLAESLGVVLGDLTAFSVGGSLAVSPGTEFSVALIPGGPRPLKQSALDYFTVGVLGPYAGRSEARRAALLHAIWQGWSLDDLRAEMDSGHFHALDADIHRRGKGGHRFLQQEWARAQTAVQEALRRPRTQEPLLPAPGVFRYSAHFHDQLHGGVDGEREEASIDTETSVLSELNWVQRWLVTAERWAISRYEGARLLTVLVILNGIGWLALLQDDPGRADRRVVELPVRSLHLVCGLLGIETVAAVLRELHDAEGSPLLRVSSGAGTLRGSRYYLRASPVTAEDLQHGAIRIDAVGPLWSVLGVGPWRVYTVLDRLGAASVAELVAAAGLGKSAVYDALRQLRAHGLVAVDQGRARVGPVDIQALAEALGATERYAAALARVRRERAEWKQVLASWNAPPPAESQPSAAAEDVEEAPPDHPGVAETLDVDQAEVAARTGPAAWDHVDLADLEPESDPYERASVEDRVVDLLVDMLGAVVTPDTETIGEVWTWPPPDGAGTRDGNVSGGRRRGEPMPARC